MQTRLADFLKDTPEGAEAERILRSCVHCGFCLATCPTYQLLGDERDSPRGRIYLMKQVMEGAPATEGVRTHLDRCLTCRACETTCPSGVEYGKLVDIGRNLVEEKTTRPPRDRIMRFGLRKVLPRRQLFGVLLRLGQGVRPLLPASLRRKVPERAAAEPWPAPAAGEQKVLLLEGCVQPAMAPGINVATARLLAKLGIELVRTPSAGCCGAISEHLAAPADAAQYMRRNIDAWWPHVERGASAVIVNASGCGAQVKQYGYLLREDPAYADKAKRIAELAKDPVELLEQHADRLAPIAAAPRRIAFQSPCTLQHGQRLNGRVEALLSRIGFELASVVDPHLCCGSAGTYSILQADLSQQLKSAKLRHLQAGAPEAIASANIGCINHLADGAQVPVRHWLELVDVKR
jgi:glycolate oxidase iron-sulfur subunit